MYCEKNKEEVLNFKHFAVYLIETLLLKNYPQDTLGDIYISNINRLVFGHLNINSLRTKFDFLCEKIKGSIDVFMICELKLDDSFPHGQFLIDGFHTSFRFDRNKNGGGIL